MAKNLKRMLSLILAISMVMSLMSVGAFAEERQPLCGKTAHTHVLEAQVEGTCACGKTEDLICTLEPHTHDACTLACEKQYDLICGKEPHSHSEDCLHKCTDTCTVVTCEKIGTYVCADPHHTNECTHKCTSECSEGCEKIGINECNIEQHDHLDTCEKHACDGSCNNVPCSLIGTNGCAFEEEHIHIAYGEENSCYVAHIHDGDCYDCGKKAHAHIALGETDSCYIIHACNVARIGTTKYMTLKAAVEAANAMETPATITMLANVDLGEKLNITNDVTIEGDYTITRADTYTGTFFEVSEGAALTLDDGLTLDGGNNWSYNGTPELKAGGDTYMTDHVNPEEGGIDATAYMIVNYGTLNANDVTIQNNYSTHEAGVIQARTNSVITIDGALIRHIASNNAGTVVQIGRNNTTSNNTALTIKGDTRITDNMGAYNGGIIMMHSHNNTFNFEGGSIDNNYVVASGTVIMSYGHWDVPGARHKVKMSGGIITKNEAEGYGSMYIHTRTDFVMTGGEIRDNISYYPNYVRSNNTATISGGLMVGNTLTTTYSLTQFASASQTSITGGIYTQNVSSYCAPGYVCIPYDQDMSAYCDLSYAPAGYDEDTRNDDYIVTPGYKVSYYEVGTKDVTNAETVTTYLDAEFLLIPKGKMHDEVVLYATPYYHFNSDNTQAINKWFTDVELTAEFDYDTEVEANLKLYGNTWEAVSNEEDTTETDETIEIADQIALAIPSVFSTDHYAYIVGYDDGTVRPTANITRAEVATIFFRLLTDEVRSMAMTRENNFSDVKAGDWYNTAVSTMAAMGIINGYPDGTFRPNAYITRAEFSAIAARFDVDGEKGDISFTDVIGHWAENEIGVAAYNGWIKGYEDNTFRPDRNINRAEAMTLVNRVLARNPESVADLLDGMRVWTDNADPKQWYYLAIQEATNSHDYERKEQGTEYWTELIEDRDWATLED